MRYFVVKVVEDQAKHQFLIPLLADAQVISSVSSSTIFLSAGLIYI